VSVSAALEKARERGMDLVEVAPEAKPPVCKVMDYNRYYYEQKKKLKENKKKSKVVQLKQIRLSPNIGKNDLKIKYIKIRKFLEEGHKVKINMRFKGRQKEHLEVGKTILMSVMNELEDIAVCQSEPKFEGYFMSVLMAPSSLKISEKKQ
jgi:translation initiation factor IF-3